MQVKKLTLGPIQTNCYVLISGSEALVVDPACEDEEIIKAIGKANLTYIILTHFHFDHTRGVVFLRSRFPSAQIAIHSADKKFIEHYHDGFAIHMGEPDDAHSVIQKETYVNFQANKFLEEGDRLEFGQEKLQVIKTSGHTPGSVCLISENDVFTGDTLFADGVGRTDLIGGDELALRNSLRKLEKKIKPGSKVHPGHGEEFVFRA